ncbi:MAG: hypothetical protein EZS28_043851 [Streblomastix strix]|uniref:Protein kinase domain-containing protein n=1 Tax=Streblomastix strix TaxID=222440 RepID=A0A5J4TRU3_9EUKA|nr:MAG: hypothetical protein EZS28_043851 [Streblomastix strix]
MIRVYLAFHNELGVIAAKVLRIEKFDEKEWDAAGALNKPEFQCPFVVKYLFAVIVIVIAKLPIVIIKFIVVIAILIIHLDGLIDQGFLVLRIFNSSASGSQFKKT